MKKSIVLLMIVAVLTAFCSCGETKQVEKPKKEEVKEVITFEKALENVKELSKDSDLSNIGNFISDKDYVYILSDGSGLRVDGSDYWSKATTYTVSELNKQFGFKEVVLAKMDITRALDGTQSCENDDFKVTWTYHPDNGLNVIYEKIEKK